VRTLCSYLESSRRVATAARRKPPQDAFLFICFHFLALCERDDHFVVALLKVVDRLVEDEFHVVDESIDEDLCMRPAEDLELRVRLWISSLPVALKVATALSFASTICMPSSFVACLRISCSAPIHLMTSTAELRISTLAPVKRREGSHSTVVMLALG
jgi:hypothetical protein